MNYVSLDEAWGKPPATTKAFSMASMKHPLLRKYDSVEQEPEQKPAEMSEPFDDTKSLKTALVELYYEHGIDALESVLPKGYLKERETYAAAVAASTQKPGLFEVLDIEEIGRWLLIGAIVYIVMDMFMSARRA
jgi:hypothetical protein